MYLSRLILNPASREVLRDIRDCQSMHRIIMRALEFLGSSFSPRSDQEVLHRLEDNRDDYPVLYVQSARMPDWSHLVNGDYLLRATDKENPAVKNIDEQLARISERMALRFRLKANPTKKVGTTTKSQRLAGELKSNGRRVPIAGEMAQIEWLLRKSADAGFRLVSVKASDTIPDVSAIDKVHTIGYRSRDRQHADQEYDKMQFAGVIFDGHLKVTNREVFLTVVRKGVGSGKAYGFGLLSLAPA
jgi:CRISPR system Cascade subunit CasE